MCLEINGKQFFDIFHIVEDKLSKGFVGIVGMPFLIKYHAMINCKTNEILFQHSSDNDPNIHITSSRTHECYTILSNGASANNDNEVQKWEVTILNRIHINETTHTLNYSIDTHNPAMMDSGEGPFFPQAIRREENSRFLPANHHNSNEQTPLNTLDNSSFSLTESSEKMQSKKFRAEQLSARDDTLVMSCNIVDKDVKITDENNTKNIFGYARTKISIPPWSKKILELKSRNALGSDDIYIIEPLTGKLPAGLLASRSVCKEKSGLFLSIINMNEKEIHINKNMQIATLSKCIEKNNTYNSDNFCGNLNMQEELPTFDHADLTWSTDINLDHLSPELKTRVENFLKDYKDIFAKSVLDLPGCSTVMHKIELKDDRPVKSKAYRVPHSLRPELDSQLDMLLEAGILQPSMSEFASPVILVKKACGQFRLAVDFRKLNRNLIKDSYPLPNITDSVDALAGSVYFSTLDLTSGFFQQEIRPEDRHKTAIITHRGLFEFTKNPFGMSTSPNAFQRLMNTILGDLNNMGILVYVDDIIVASKDIDSHFEKLKVVFNRLKQHNLKLKPSKCIFLNTSIQYLGFEISKGQVFPINKNIEVIKQFKIPNSRKAVRSYLGTLGFYRRFIPDFSKRTIHLTNLTKSTGRFIWTSEHQKEFEDLQAALASKPCLALPDFSKDFQLYTDASGEALGAVLTQLDENNYPHPVAFASRKLKDAETRYSTTERELLALVWATSHFKCYLANKHFYIFTDHAPLTYMLKIQDPTSRMAKWICTLADYNFTIKFIKGKCNSVADFLSRYVNHQVNNINLVGSVLDAGESDETVFEPRSDLIGKIHDMQKTDAKCISIAEKISKNIPIAPRYLKFFFQEDLLVCEDTRGSDLVGKAIKIVVPKCMKLEIFNVTHESLSACHQGFHKTIDRIRQNFYWPGLTSDVRNLINSCRSCQERRVHKANDLAPLQRAPTPSSPFFVVHCDVIGPLPTTVSGNKYIVSYIDAFSKWIEAYAVPAQNSEIIADTLSDFICRHGAPSRLVTDNGSVFVSKAIEHVYRQFNIIQIKTSPYHAAGNAKSERSHRTLINALSHIINENQLDWDIKLKFALLAMRTSVHSATKLTPAAVVYGRNLNLPHTVFNSINSNKYNDAPTYCEALIPSLQKVFSVVHKNLIKASEIQERYREKSAVIKDLKVGDAVWLYTPAIKPNRCKKLSKLNSGPFLIIEKMNEVNYKIAPESNLSKTQVVHVDRLSKVVNRMQFPSPLTEQSQEQVGKNVSQEHSTEPAYLHTDTPTRSGIQPRSNQSEGKIMNTFQDIFWRGTKGGQNNAISPNPANRAFRTKYNLRNLAK